MPQKFMMKCWKPLAEAAPSYATVTLWITEFKGERDSVKND